MEYFSNMVQLTKTAHTRVITAVNSEMANLYWKVGQYIFGQMENATWGDGTVKELAQYIQKHHPEIKGFDKKFFTTCAGFIKLTPICYLSHNWSDKFNNQTINKHSIQYKGLKRYQQ